MRGSSLWAREPSEGGEVRGGQRAGLGEQLPGRLARVGHPGRVRAGGREEEVGEPHLLRAHVVLAVAGVGVGELGLGHGREGVVEPRAHEPGHERPLGGRHHLGVVLQPARERLLDEQLVAREALDVLALALQGLVALALRGAHLLQALAQFLGRHPVSAPGDDGRAAGRAGMAQVHPGRPGAGLRSQPTRASTEKASTARVERRRAGDMEGVPGG
ncbi:hypothetical protein ACN28S_62270 [Cystobacter fuscus]